MEKHIIICPHCNKEVDTHLAHRNCGNCFSCTGCERYQCPFCDKEIVIKALQKIDTRTLHS